MLIIMKFFKFILLTIRITIFLVLSLFYFCSLGLLFILPLYLSFALSYLTFIWHIDYTNYCSTDFLCNIGVIFGVVFLAFTVFILISILAWSIARYISIKITWCFLFITTGVLLPDYFNTFL
ncbi:hypothetical protein C2G38_2105609 [Gigaspora rosea]|uniref:Uncharacterized protein n=1 Tax=Gigaspora rosea TaxID=44941 RepID=A0A397UMZ3_9GLOM|nr:hypothetical protein C2G38_2105609 [Gigaspora rosea]